MARRSPGRGRGLECARGGAGLGSPAAEEFIDTVAAIVEEHGNVRCLTHGRTPAKPFEISFWIMAGLHLEARGKDPAYFAI